MIKYIMQLSEETMSLVKELEVAGGDAVADLAGDYWYVILTGVGDRLAIGVSKDLDTAIQTAILYWKEIK